MRPFELFDTESRQLKEVRAHFGDTLRYYTCGPTVYDFAHIGNLRTFVVEDLIKRAMLYFGLKVKHVMNLTDVDDKTIRGALKNSQSLIEYTQQYTDAFHEDLKSMNILPADLYPKATAYIPQMIEMVALLLQKGIAYKGQDGSIYFSIKKFPHYGKLSHLKLDELTVNAGERLSQDEYTKEHLSDFVLWKAYDEARDGSIFWESPYGRGRPGWHLECSVMAQRELGEEIDLHAGGVDLIFPHHENEIAQSEACCGKEFSRTWVHVEHLLVDNKKMSKSLGNFYTLRDLMKLGYSCRVVRLMLIQAHYRMQMNFTMQGLDGAKQTLQRIDDFILRLHEYKTYATTSMLQEYFHKVNADFREAIRADLNVSEAFQILFDLIRHINGLIDQKALIKCDVEELFLQLKKFDSVLGIMNFETQEIPETVLALVKEREQVRAAKNFKRSDEIRGELAALGYAVEDTPEGARIKKM